jgi:tetratricopeptide (TPR) repeat protein
LGYGYENYNIAFNKYFNPLIYRDAGSQIWFDRAHNVVFDILVTSGILGMIAYGAMYGLALASAWKCARRDDPFVRVSGGIVLGLVTAHFLQNFFVFDILATYVPLMLVFACIDSLAYRAAGGAPQEVRAAGEGSMGLAAVLVAPFFVFALYAFNINPARVNIAGLEAMRLRFAERYGDAYQAFLNLEKRGTYQLPEIRTKFVELALEARGKRGVTDQQASAIINDAVTSMLANIRETPKDAQNYLYLMNLYFLGGRYDTSRYAQMEKAGEEALALSPTRPQIYYLLGQGASARKENDKSVEYFKAAAELNPAVYDSQWNLAVAYRFAGKKEEERKVYDILEGMGLSFDARESLDDQSLQRLTQRFVSLKEYAPLAQVFEVLVARHPDNSEYWGNLAAAYKSSGNWKKARDAAEKVRALNPAAQNELDQFLKEVNEEEKQSALGGKSQ